MIIKERPELIEDNDNFSLLWVPLPEGRNNILGVAANSDRNLFYIPYHACRKISDADWDSLIKSITKESTAKEFIAKARSLKIGIVEFIDLGDIGDDLAKEAAKGWLHD